MSRSSHGSTFGGNPLACAVANAVLDVMLADGFLAEVQRKAEFLHDQLAAKIAEFGDVMELVRGRGLMVGIKTHVPNTEFAQALRDQEMLSVPAADNVVRLLPPLTASDEEIGIAIERVGAAAQTFAHKAEVA